jgi:hypothetical protein
MVVLLFLSASWSAWGTSSSSANGEPMDQKAIYNWFNHISACNQKFAGQNPDKGFAVSLAQLGPTGTQCLSQEEVSGPIGARKPQYEPGPAQNGRISTYHLRTQDPGFFTDRYWLDTNQRGIILALGKNGYEMPPGDVRGFGRGIARDVAWYSRCLDRIFQKNGTFPATLQPATKQSDCFPKLNESFFHYNDENTLAGPDYTYTYVPLQGASGQLDNFQLNARPQKYGINGLRSYLVSKDQVVHATPEDRPAQPTDPSDVSSDQ